MKNKIQYLKILTFGFLLFFTFLGTTSFSKDLAPATVSPLIFNFPPPDCFIVDVSVTPVTCYGGSDGSLCFTITSNPGGNNSYSVIISQSGQNIFDGTISQDEEFCIGGLSNLEYEISVTGPEACMGLFPIGGPSSPIEISNSDTNPVSCYGEEDGGVTISVNGDPDDFSYEWSNESTASDLDNIGAGTYTVTITDIMFGCTLVSEDFIVTSPDSIIAELTSTPITCNGASDGSITLVVSGGSPGYSYVWNNGSTSMNLNNLDTGNYNVTITDSDECTSVSQTIVLEEPAPITFDVTSNDITCFGENDGSASVNNPSGGNGSPYTYAWSNNQTGQEINNLSEGNYQLTVYDSEGCEEEYDEIEIIEPLPITAEEVVIDVQCFGGSDGSISLSPNGGSPGYIFTWSTMENDSVINDLSIGDYTYTITDLNGCTYSNTINIEQPVELFANATLLSNITCNSDSDGSAEIMPSGGTGTPTALWDNGETTFAIKDLAEGIYTVIITDENDCTAAGMVQVEKELDPIIIAFEDEVTYMNGEMTNLIYEADQNLVEYSWTVISTQNIDTNASDYQETGIASSAIKSTFRLLSERTIGWLLIEVFPIKGACTGNTVLTRINLNHDDGGLFIPDLFTPNNDGTNDSWDILFPEPVSSSDYSVKIFNRSGGLVFEEAPFSGEWEAIGCPDGVYYYVINHNSNDETYKGAVTIMRK